jgi:hypothetical protein
LHGIKTEQTSCSVSWPAWLWSAEVNFALSISFEHVSDLWLQQHPDISNIETWRNSLRFHPQTYGLNIKANSLEIRMVRYTNICLAPFYMFLSFYWWKTKCTKKWVKGSPSFSLVDSGCVSIHS